MRLCTFEHQGKVHAGRIEDDSVVELAEGDLGQLIAEIDAAKLSGLRGAQHPLDEVKLLAPIPRPPKFAAVGLNYADHAREQGKEPPDFPMFFAKARTCVIGPGDAIRLPEGRHHIDVEVELGVVYARRGLRVPRSRALDHILGFTLVNDVSDRKAQKDDKQYYRAKSWPTFGPMGPWVVTPDEFDHRDAPIRLWRNGFLQQDSRTSQLVFSVEELTEILSSFAELEPGDVLATGTPSGVGVFRNPPVYLQPGDRIEMEIEGLGRLENAVTS